MSTEWARFHGRRGKHGTKDVQKLEDAYSEIDHVKDVLWYDDVADLTLPVEMIPKNLREAFFKGDATMMLVLFDNTTSSDEAMEALTEMRKISNDQCFLSGMTGIVTDIKNLALSEMPAYVVIAAILCFIVLQLFTDSFLVPLFFLLSIGISILYNMGTNVFLGEISYITQALVAVLQLGVTMDYSISFLAAMRKIKNVSQMIGSVRWVMQSPIPLSLSWEALLQQLLVLPHFVL